MKFDKADYLFFGGLAVWGIANAVFDGFDDRWSLAALLILFGLYAGHTAIIVRRRLREIRHTMEWLQQQEEKWKAG